MPTAQITKNPRQNHPFRPLTAQPSPFCRQKRVPRQNARRLSLNAQRNRRGPSVLPVTGTSSPSRPQKPLGQHGQDGQHGQHVKTRPFWPSAASSAARRPRPTLTSPSQVVFLLHTSGARPATSLLGVAGSFDFVVAVQRRAFPQRKAPSPADSCLRPRLIFLPLVATACTTRTSASTGADDDRTLTRQILAYPHATNHSSRPFRLRAWSRYPVKLRAHSAPAPTTALRGQK